MERFYGYRIKLVLIGFIATIVLNSETANGDFTFGEPNTLWPALNSPYMDGSPIVTADGLSLLFGSNRPNGGFQSDLWVAMRETLEEDWGIPVPLENVCSSADEACLSLSADGLSLFFSSFIGTPRPGGQGKCDIWLTTRAKTTDPWGQPENLAPPVNTSSNDYGPFIWVDGCTLLFSSDRPGGSGNDDLWMTTRETKDDKWTDPVPMENINSNDNELFPVISSDGRIIFFQRGLQSTTDLWMATRKNLDESFGPPERLPSPINYPDCDDCNPRFSADGSTLYFSTNNWAPSWDYDWWQVPILPIIDLNSDGIVNAEDLCIIVDNWHTDNPLCDIGPMPWGDGIVDVQDLIVLAKHLFEEFPLAEPVE